MSGALNKKRRRPRIMLITIAVIASLIIVKMLWVTCATSGLGDWDSERKDIIRRANFLTERVATSPQQVMDEMPSGIGGQFKGEWALYTCSMTSAALANIALLYPQNKEVSLKYIDKIIDIALSEEIREYDALRWGEDPMDGIYGELSHISYYSHLAWMISRYKEIGGDDKYDWEYRALCEAMNRRICESIYLNLPTYPGESIYVPDMLVAIVALNYYAKQNGGRYLDTVKLWVERAKREWIDQETGLLASFLEVDGDSLKVAPSIKGSYSSLNCYYLSLVDKGFAMEQYELLKKHFKQIFPVAGIKEYHDHSCWLGVDIDAGPIIMNLSSSGTAFAIGCATNLGDMEFRKQLLKTAEIAGSTISWLGQSHYLLANLALVGEAIALAMRTTR